MTWAKSHLRAKFKHSFQETLHPSCSCGKEAETTSHFLLSCFNCYDESSTFQSKFRNINPNILETPFLKLPSSLYTEIRIKSTTLSVSIPFLTIWYFFYSFMILGTRFLMTQHFQYLFFHYCVFYFILQVL